MEKAKSFQRSAFGGNGRLAQVPATGIGEKKQNGHLISINELIKWIILSAVPEAAGGCPAAS